MPDQLTGVRVAHLTLVDSVDESTPAASTDRKSTRAEEQLGHELVEALVAPADRRERVDVRGLLAQAFEPVLTVLGALLHWRMVAVGGEGGRMMPRRSRPVLAVPSSAFAGFRFPPEIIVLAVRWYLRYGISYRDVEELLTDRGIEVDHVTVYRWVQRFTPLLADAARPCRHSIGDTWYVDETYVKVAGRWRYVYRAIDQYGQIIDVYVSALRDARAARRFFVTVLGDHGEPTEVVIDRAWTLRAVIDALIPGAFHNTEEYANNRIEADHGQLKARLRPMRGFKRDHSARVVMRGHAFMQNIRRGHYELGVDARAHRRVAGAFTELARTI